MIGEYHVLACQDLDRAEKGFEFFRIIEIGRYIAELIEYLRQHRSAKPVAASPQVDEDEIGGPRVGHQLRRQHAPNVLAGRESRHNQGHRRDYFSRRAALVPGGAHRQGILAHRNRYAQLRT